MFRSRLFWKLVLAAAAVHACCSAGLITWLVARERAAAIKQAEGELVRVARSASVAVARQQSTTPAGGASDGLQALLTRFGEAAGVRLAVLDASGGVLARSAGGVASAAGLAERPEVEKALAGQSAGGMATGPPAGLSVQAACPVERGSESDGPAVVWASRSLAGVDAAIDTRRNAMMGAAALLTLAFAVVIGLLARRVVGPVLTLNEAADAIIRGDYKQTRYVTSADELGDLAKNLSRIRNELGFQLNELREGGQRTATVLGGMIEGVIAVDERERVLLANAAAGQLFGFIPPQIEGRPLLEVVRHHALHQAVASALATARPQRLETEWEDAQERRSLLVQITPLPGDPCPGVVTVMHDTTELRRLESLRQDFVANVSHELKTPLSSIKAYTETLLSGAVNDTEHNIPFLRRIEEQADRLNNLIQDLLALARIESEQQPFEIQPVAVESLIDSCLSDYRPKAEGKEIALTSEPPGGRLLAKADAEGLRVILNNLVDNAIKYTPAGGRVTVRWGEATAGMMQIDVADTGIGIPKDELPRVFERFYRVDKARSRELGGTGLGLAIVKHLTYAFAGSVDVASELGEGTVFTVKLPAG